MFNKIKTLLLVLSAVVALFSCSPSIPKDEPDLGIDIDMSQLNTMIKVTVPESVNSYEPGKPLELEIENLSTHELKFRPDEIQIFRVDNKQWQKTPNKMKTMIVDDFIIEANEVYSTVDLTLAPNGVFPGYKELVSILPDVKSNETVFLRIFVFAYSQELENMPQNIVGAFVDVPLRP